MSFKAKTFYVDRTKGANFAAVTDSLSADIGLEGDYIRLMEAVSLGNGNVQLTVYYNTEAITSVLAFSPPPGAVVPTGTDINHASLLFSNKIDAARISSGSFSFDGTGIGTGNWSVESGNYIVKVQLPASARGLSGYHSLEINSNKLYYQNAEHIQHSSVLAYNINSKASPSPGQPIPYTFTSGRRGEVAIDGFVITKSVLPSDRINDFLKEKGLSSDRLIASTSIDIGPDVIYIFFAYFKTLEPQLLYTFPYIYSLSIDSAAPREILFIFREPLDKNYVRNTLGLFKIVSNFTTTTNIPLNKISIDEDGKTVRILTAGVLTSTGVYDFRISGLRSADGVLLSRDIIYSIQVFPYSSDGGIGGNITGFSGITGLAGGLVFADASLRIVKVSGLDSTIVVDPTGIYVGTINASNVNANQIVKSIVLTGRSFYDNITLTGISSAKLSMIGNILTVSGISGAPPSLGYITTGNNTADLVNSARLVMDGPMQATYGVGTATINYTGRLSNQQDISLVGVRSGQALVFNSTNSLWSNTGIVLSFNSRTGILLPETNDYTWAQVNKATSNIADITTRSHTSLTDVGTKTHAQIETDLTYYSGMDLTISGMVTNVSGILYNQVVNISGQLIGISGQLVSSSGLLNTKISTVSGILDTHTGSNIAHGTSSAIVGISDTQTLTNKTAIGLTNTIAATHIQTNTVTVRVSGSDPPISGMFLKATGPNIGMWDSGQLSNLADVAVPSPANNDILTYNSVQGRWVNFSPASLVGITDLDNLSNVLVANTSHGQILVFNTGAVSGTTTGQWMNTTLIPVSGISKNYVTGEGLYVSAQVAGAVVGTTDTQTLSNKTITGGVFLGSSVFSGTLLVTGNSIFSSQISGASAVFSGSISLYPAATGDTALKLVSYDGVNTITGFRIDGQGNIFLRGDHVNANSRFRPLIVNIGDGAGGIYDFIRFGNADFSQDRMFVGTSFGLTLYGGSSNQDLLRVVYGTYGGGQDQKLCLDYLGHLSGNSYAFTGNALVGRNLTVSGNLSSATFSTTGSITGSVLKLAAPADRTPIISLYDTSNLEAASIFFAPVIGTAPELSISGSRIILPGGVLRFPYTSTIEYVNNHTSLVTAGGWNVVSPSIVLSGKALVSGNLTATGIGTFSGLVSCTTGSSHSPLILTAGVGVDLFQFKTTGSHTLWRSSWDGGNQHHYFNATQYYNLNSNSFVFGGGSVYSDYLIINSIDQNKQLEFAASAYATSGTPLTTNVIKFKTWMWDGAVGYNSGSQTRIYVSQTGYGNDCSLLGIEVGISPNNSTRIAVTNPGGAVGIGTTTPVAPFQVTGNAVFSSQISGASLRVSGYTDLVGGTTIFPNLTITGNGHIISLQNGQGQSVILATPTGQDIILRVGNSLNVSQSTRDTRFWCGGGGYSNVTWGGGGTEQYTNYGNYFHIGYNSFILRSMSGGAQGFSPISIEGYSGVQLLSNQNIIFKSVLGAEVPVRITGSLYVSSGISGSSLETTGNLKSRTLTISGLDAGGNSAEIPLRVVGGIHTEYLPVAVFGRANDTQIPPSPSLHSGVVDITASGNAYLRLYSSQNAGTVGIDLQGAGHRGSILADGSYNMYIQPNAEYGNGNLIICPINSYNDSGNVAIGPVTNPTDRLVVCSSGNAGQYYAVAISTTVPCIKFGTSSTYENYLKIGAYNSINNIDTKTRDLKIFSTAAPTGITFLAASGYVGIDTATPTSKLTVYGGHPTYIDANASYRNDWAAGYKINDRLALSTYWNNTLHIAPTGGWGTVFVGAPGSSAANLTVANFFGAYVSGNVAGYGGFFGASLGVSGLVNIMGSTASGFLNIYDAGSRIMFAATNASCGRWALVRSDGFVGVDLIAGGDSYLTSYLAVGGNTVNASCVLDVQSTSRGLGYPMMTTVQRTGIASPRSGLHVYDITTSSPWFYNGSWVEVGSATDISGSYSGVMFNSLTLTGTTTVYGNIIPGVDSAYTLGDWSYRFARVHARGLYATNNTLSLGGGTITFSDANSIAQAAFSSGLALGAEYINSAVPSGGAIIRGNVSIDRQLSVGTITSTGIAALTYIRASAQSYFNNGVCINGNPIFSGASEHRTPGKYGYARSSSYRIKLTDVIQYENGDYPEVTGALVITLPCQQNNIMWEFGIDGSCYQNNLGAWSARAYGYAYLPDMAWYNQAAYIKGQTPFTQVRFGIYNRTGVVILGDTGTVWNYPHITLAFANTNNYIEGLITGWDIGLTGSLSAFSGIVSADVTHSEITGGTHTFKKLNVSSTSNFLGNSVFSGSVDTQSLIVRGNNSPGTITGNFYMGDSTNGYIYVGTNNARRVLNFYNTGLTLGAQFLQQGYWHLNIAENVHFVISQNNIERFRIGATATNISGDLYLSGSQTVTGTSLHTNWVRISGQTNSTSYLRLSNTNAAATSYFGILFDDSVYTNANAGSILFNSSTAAQWGRGFSIYGDYVMFAAGGGGSSAQLVAGGGSTLRLGHTGSSRATVDVSGTFLFTGGISKVQYTNTVTTSNTVTIASLSCITGATLGIGGTSTTVGGGIQFLNFGYNHAGIRFSGYNLIVEPASNSYAAPTWYSSSESINLLIRNGSLGIGTLSPSASFHVTGKSRLDDSVNISGDLYVSGNLTTTGTIISNTYFKAKGANASLQFEDTNDPANVSKWYNTDNKVALWHNSYGDQFSVSPDVAHLGIPTYASFHVGGNLVLSGDQISMSNGAESSLTANTSSYSSNQFRIMSKTTKGAIIGIGGTNTTVGAGIQFLNNGVKHAAFVFSGGHLIIEDASSNERPDLWYGGQSVNLLIRNGCLGVGTLTPSYGLHVTGNAYIGSSLNANTRVLVGNPPNDGITAFIVTGDAHLFNNLTVDGTINGVNITGIQLSATEEAKRYAFMLM